MLAARLREIAIRLCALVGLTVSAMLLANVLGHVALFCGPEGGCSAVQHSEWAKPFGLPMPYLGLAFFGVTLVLTLRPHARAGRWLTLWASGGALTSLILLGLQLFVIGEVCPLCVVVDLTGVALGALALWRELRPPASAPGQDALAYRPLSAALGALAVAIPLAMLNLVHRPPHRHGPAPEPATGAALELVNAQARPGVATVIDFVDFQCPYCRSLHKQLVPVLAKRAGRVRVVRKHLPLNMHKRAAPAARAVLCAEATSPAAGDAVAERLISGDLDDGAIDRAARAAGLDVAALRTCMASPAIQQRLDADKKLALDIGVRGLPTLFIGSTRVMGDQDTATLEKLLDAAVAAP
ncbi:MAG: vitamin K epoxide reductase family protein [Deltaproteobacteria bacterium]|nr:vitamin K epoxide reductase family protein [Deltaproteobacteria bacterium]